MKLSIGIVGLPNVGKSTLFKAITKQQVTIANYPFATIDPNVGVVAVPDERLTKLTEMSHSKKTIPAVVEFYDIAGLVKGAAEGEGLGNKFLSHVREMDIICHVVRFFPDPNIVHVAGAVDPVRDREIVETELALADLQTLAKQAEPKQTATKEERVRWGVIEKLKEGLNNGKLARDVITDPGLRSAIHDLQLLTMKPMMYVANVAENQLNEKNAMLAICAETESQLAGLSEAEQKEYLKSLGLEKSGLDRLIQKAYEMLGLISFLTTGVIESRAWTIENGMKAPTAAGVIHTDFEKKFIKADCVAFDDFIALGGWKTSREEGKVRSEGKEYVMRDGDVVEFKVGT